MVMKPIKVRHRRLAVESLEKREVLTAYINELMFAPASGTTISGQYVELRGEPDATIDPGTYLLVISDDTRAQTNPGVVNGIFDLSGKKWGSNGMLVLLPQNSPYKLGAGLVAGGPAPTILRSTSPGFDALPGNIYKDLFTGANELNSLAGSASFFLIHSGVKPKLGDDIDRDDNGTIDIGNAALINWDVLDSISLHDNVFSGSVAYGQVAFIQRLGSTEPPVATPVETQVVYTEGFGYAARIGDSTGHAASDWVAGTVRSPATGQNQSYYRFGNGFSEVPEPYSFTGRELDHLGESNFFGGVHGTVTQTIVNSAGLDEVVPVAGVKFLADTNDNGKRDVINYSYDPDGFAVDAELTNVFPGVTLTTFNTTDGIIGGYDIKSKLENSNPGTINHVFGPLVFPFFTDFFRLRIDFAQPVRSVSLDAIGQSNFTASLGRLEAFNAAGESLGVANSFALFSGGSQQTLRVNVGDDVIAYAVAYAPETSPFFTGFDDLKFSQSESIAVTDVNGEFNLNHLLPDEYTIVPFADPTLHFAVPLPKTPVSITRYENKELNFSVKLNTDPTIAAATFEIDENAAVNAPVGTVVATDIDLTQTITFSIENSSPFRIDPVTGQLFVQSPALLDFETTPRITVAVNATDNVGGAITKNILVQLRDINEAPVVTTVSPYLVSEEADNQSAFGRVNAVDPEAPDVAPKFVITGGTGASVFSIEESTGILRVADASLLDFETKPLLTLNVVVSDHSATPLKTTVALNIALTNANDAPVITTTSMNASEATAIGTNIGTVSFTEPDVGQSHSFRLLDDSNGRFQIDSNTGIVSLVGTLDFETAAKHEIVVQIVDSGTPPQGTTKTIDINVLNENEPAVLINSNFFAFENVTSGSLIGSLVAIDPEGLTNLKFSSIDTSNPTLLFGGRVKLDPVTGTMTLANNSVLDADVANATLSDRVRILSGTSIVGEALIKLIVLNVNEAPIIASQQRLGLPQGLPSGRVFAQLVVSDPENDHVILTVIGESASKFGIDSSNRLFVIPGETIDFTSDPEVEVEVLATDAKGNTATGTVTVIAAPLPPFGTTIPFQSFASGSEIAYALPPQYRAEGVKSLSLAGPNNKLPSGLSFDPLVARFSGIAAPSANGTYILTVQASVQDGDAVVVKEQTFNLTITRPSLPLVNVPNPFDVDANGKVEPIDALRVINLLVRLRGSDSTIQEIANTSLFFYDTNRSNTVTAADALAVVNHLARVARNTTTEPESTVEFVDTQASKSKTTDAALHGYLTESKIF